MCTWCEINPREKEISMHKDHLPSHQGCSVARGCDFLISTATKPRNTDFISRFLKDLTLAANERTHVDNGNKYTVARASSYHIDSDSFKLPLR